MKYLALEKKVGGANWSNTESILKDEAKRISELKPYAGFSRLYND